MHFDAFDAVDAFDAFDGIAVVIGGHGGRTPMPPDTPESLIRPSLKLLNGRGFSRVRRKTGEVVMVVELVVESAVVVGGTPGVARAGDGAA
jgi:hypothetical protein